MAPRRSIIRPSRRDTARDAVSVFSSSNLSVPTSRINDLASVTTDETNGTLQPIRPSASTPADHLMANLAVLADTAAQSSAVFARNPSSTAFKAPLDILSSPLTTSTSRLGIFAGIRIRFFQALFIPHRIRQLVREFQDEGGSVVPADEEAHYLIMPSVSDACDPDEAYSGSPVGRVTPAPVQHQDLDPIDRVQYVSSAWVWDCLSTRRRLDLVAWKSEAAEGDVNVGPDKSLTTSDQTRTGGNGRKRRRREFDQIADHDWVRFDAIWTAMGLFDWDTQSRASFYRMYADQETRKNQAAKLQRPNVSPTAIQEFVRKYRAQYEMCHLGFQARGRPSDRGKRIMTKKEVNQTPYPRDDGYLGASGSLVEDMLPNILPMSPTTSSQARTEWTAVAPLSLPAKHRSYEADGPDSADQEESSDHSYVQDADGHASARKFVPSASEHNIPSMSSAKRSGTLQDVLLKDLPLEHEQIVLKWLTSEEEWLKSPYLSSSHGPDHGERLSWQEVKRNFLPSSERLSERVVDEVLCFALTGPGATNLLGFSAMFYDKVEKTNITEALYIEGYQEEDVLSGKDWVFPIPLIDRWILCRVHRPQRTITVYDCGEDQADLPAEVMERICDFLEVSLSELDRTGLTVPDELARKLEKMYELVRGAPGRYLVCLAIAIISADDSEDAKQLILSSECPLAQTELARRLLWFLGSRDIP
ncbi:hypothetical protein BCR39DRAFT_551988 [Naematelia encephala]|uniref:BRCT domain-containing protein n=1 Tax=Naematelia encephala TaxID=71784 RepID=A0A1Y2AIY4_9TREE|nr:hypothetical protein BCR39DRAFT_551988 [Naematelia encephala]